MTMSARRLLAIILCAIVPVLAHALGTAQRVPSELGWDEALYRQIEAGIRVPQFAEKDYVITSYGARSNADAVTNQKAIQKAIDKCSKRGGGRVVVPDGQTFLTTAIRLKDGVNLHIGRDAVLQFVFEPEHYPIVETSWEGLDCFNLSPCIYAFQAKDIGITGQGTIDGGGSVETWWPWCGAARYGWQEGMVSQKNGARARLMQNGEDGVPMNDSRRVFGPTDGLRPQLIGLNQCNGILIEDVTLLRSPFWVLHPLKSTDVTVRRVRFINDGPNGDGCDPESCNRVLIEDCFFNTGDDCIAIKSGRNRDGRERAMPSQNIIIRRCEMKNGHGGVVVGSEISGGARNIFAHDCVMDSPQLERVLRIKTNSCRGGIIERIYMRDIKVGTCRESVLKINLDYEHNEVCCRGYYPTVRHIYMERVSSQASKYGVQIIGLNEDTFVHNIYVRNSRFDGVREGNFISGKTRDIHLDSLFVNGSLVLTEMPYKHYSEWMTRSEMQRSPKSYLLDFSTRPKWSYVMGIELEAMLDTWLRYGGDDIRDYCREYTDTLIDTDGRIRGYNLLDYNLDNIRTGHFVTRMYQLWPEPKNLVALKTLMKQLQEQPRTRTDDVYWHKAIYAWQVWLDGIFMGLPFRCLTAPIVNSKSSASNVKRTSFYDRGIYDDAVNQLTATYARTLDPATGLNRHAYDETRHAFWADSITGLSQHCWARAQGWFTMALVEVLDALPEDYPRRHEVVSLLQKDLEAVVSCQDKQTGLWYQVMDTPGREGNYLESTASCMFAYALLKAYRKGYVGAKYREAGIKAYRGIIRNFIRVNADQTISLTTCCAVAGLGPAATPEVEAAMRQVNPKGTVRENRRRDGSFAYYLSEPVRDNDAKGIGPFIWASLEMEQLGFDTQNTLTLIDREAVLTRNNPIVTTPDSLSSLTVGNGRFAATVDITGFQSYPLHYAAGIPLNSMSDWGWHTFPNPDNLTPSESERTYDLGHGHPETYAVEYKQASDGRHHDATAYFRINPHRLNLGTLGLDLRDKQGQAIPIHKLHDVRQDLKLWDGEIQSSFTADGQSAEVTTAVMPDRDAVYARIQSPLLADGKASVTLRFSYPTGRHADDANDWSKPERHQSTVINVNKYAAIIERTLDDTRYYVLLHWSGEAKFQQYDNHYFRLTPSSDVFCVCAEYLPALPAQRSMPFDYASARKNTQRYWHDYWQSGAFADFSACTDPRAPELERRVVLSQYLTRVNCANSLPPQETGLTYNSWFGRPHLEMAWWHLTDFALWNHSEVIAPILHWYNTVAYPEARKIAQRQGFKGVRWMKMTDPWAGEAPSNTGSFLIWQQPHYIYLAEEMYRANPTPATLRQYAEQVEATAEFMADFVTFDSATNRYTIRGATAMQESMSKDLCYNQPFELAYWQYGLDMANQWRQRQGKARIVQWDHIVAHLSPLPSHQDIYTAGISNGNQGGLTVFNPFDTVASTSSAAALAVSPSESFAEKSCKDHPAVLGACGLLPSDQTPYTLLYDKDTMRRTLRWAVQHWNWPSVWGWDFGMTAMAAARLGDPHSALSLLLSDEPKNTYLLNGHNFQTADRLRIYLPGNGALLTAVAMMCAGWDGCPNPHNPGFPNDGTWNVRWEGLVRMQ